MPKEYPTTIVQPPGSHNKPFPCIETKEAKEYLDYLPFKWFNPVQSEYLPYNEDDDTNIVVAAATSSGKTVIAELFAARAISQGKRILYIAPMKALADEKFSDWKNPEHTFSKFKVEILTGDINVTEALKIRLKDADIIILTPEMFNSKCRSFASHSWLEKSVFIGDEIHLLGLKNRGDAVEVGLIQYFENSPKSRALFLSATLPNVSDFGKWLTHMTGRESKVIISDYRPCKLNKRIEVFLGGKTYAKTEEHRMAKVIELIEQYKDESILVFTGSKMFGHKLSDALKRINIDHRFHNADVNRESKKTKDGDIIHGRKDIEDQFRNGTFNVLIATTTMAWGCFTGDSQVTTENGFEDFSRVGKSKIISCENFKREKSRKINKIIVDNKIPMKKIVLKSGISIVCTNNHVFPLFKGGEKEASNIVVGDCLISDKKVSTSNIINELSVDICYLIGLIAGDGYIDKKSVDFCVPEESIRTKVKNILMDLKFKFKSSNNRFDKVEHLRLNKESRDFFIKHVGYSDKKEKKIDFNFIGNKEEMLLGILAGLMDSDGGVDSNKICFYNTSHHLINFFVMAMRRFGITTSVRLKNPVKKILFDKTGRKMEINSKKKCYELIIGSSAGFFFFWKNIMPLMASKNRILKIKKIYNKTYISNVKLLKMGDICASVYGLRNRKTFDIFKKTCIYCADKNGAPLSKILDHTENNRVFARMDVFNGFFEIKTKKINGKGQYRKHYIPNVLGTILKQSTDFASFVENATQNGFNIVDKKARNTCSEIKNDFFPDPVRYILEENPSDIVFDLSVQENNHHHYIVNGTVVHNCNTPARYVILSHTKFGLTPMHPSNIIQAMGRAGRAGWSDKGDAIIVVPNNDKDREPKRIFSDYLVTSTLGDPNTLMFHILSYVCDGTITTPEGLFEWYKKTLSSVQNKPLDMERCSLVLRNLEMRDMITSKNGEYKPTILGKITARMYMSPLDVSDWYRNFGKLYRIKSRPGASEEEEQNDNLRIAMALGQCYNWGVTWKYNEEQKKHVLSVSPDVYITEMEKNTPEVLEVSSLLNRSPEGYPTIKYVSIFYQLLSGKEVSPPLNSYYMGITRDIERIISTLEQCDMQVGRYFHKKDPIKVPGYGWGSDWKNLGCRLKYGVRSSLAELVNLPWVGKKKAESLEAKGITTEEAFRNPSNKDICEKAVGKKTYQKILTGLSS